MPVVAQNRDEAVSGRAAGAQTSVEVAEPAVNRHFGEHLMIDGYGGSQALLDDATLVRSCLTALPALLRMNILGTPTVYRAEDNHSKDPGGWTGMVVLVESHISIHTFPMRGFVSADVYTCHNGMDRHLIRQFFTERFHLADVEAQFVERGRRYPEQNIY